MLGLYFFVHAFNANKIELLRFFCLAPYKKKPKVICLKFLTLFHNAIDIHAYSVKSYKHILGNVRDNKV